MRSRVFVRFAAVLLLMMVAAVACRSTTTNNTAPPAPPVQLGDPVVQAALDFDKRPPTGGPRPDTSTNVSGTTLSNPQSPDAAAVENAFLVMTNDARARVGVNGVGREPGLDGYARNVAATIAAAGVLTHSDIRDILGAWWIAGENIGYGPSPIPLEQAFEASAGHYQNIINPLFGAVGIGVFVDPAGLLWVALDFAG